MALMTRWKSHVGAAVLPLAPRRQWSTWLPVLALSIVLVGGYFVMEQKLTAGTKGNSRGCLDVRPALTSPDVQKILSKYLSQAKNRSTAGPAAAHRTRGGGEDDLDKLTQALAAALKRMEEEQNVVDAAIATTTTSSGSNSVQTLPGVGNPKHQQERQSDGRLRVYMYDLPPKFTYGVIESYLRCRNLLTKGADGKALVYPRHQHSAEWWLFIDLLGKGEKQSLSAAVRVTDPDDTDVFFVPFFSSLSLLMRPLNESNARGSSQGQSAKSAVEHGMSEPQRYAVTLQRELLEWLNKQPTWHRNLGRDHLFVAQDPNALVIIRPTIRRSIMLVSDFGRMSPDEGNLVKDVVIPYAHRIPTYDESSPPLERQTLLFFGGNRFRKDGGRIRDFLFKVLVNETGVVMVEGTPTKAGTQFARLQMRTSKFCLHPAGDTPSACRLFDAIVNLCVPVIVSDGIELPFEKELDYSEFCIFISSEKATKRGAIVDTLKAVQPAQLQKYQNRLREVQKYFEYDGIDGAVNHIWKAVANKLPLVRTMINRDRRLVKGVKKDCRCTCNSWGSPEFEEGQIYAWQNISRNVSEETILRNAQQWLDEVIVDGTW